MKKALALLLCACSTGWAVPGSTGNTCHGGATGSASTSVCTASMNVTAGNVVFCIVTGNTARTISSVTQTGTSAITWTVVAALNVNDATNDQYIAGAWGNVTGTGTTTPTANMSGATSFHGIYCSEFNGVQAVTDGAIATDSAGSSSTNGVVSGNITTTANGDLLLGGTLQTDGTTATITAGTVSVAYTKLLCNTDSGNNLCMEWGTQTTAAASTAADWTYNAVHRATSNELAVKAAAGVAATSGFSKKDKLAKFGAI